MAINLLPNRAVTSLAIAFARRRSQRRLPIYSCFSREFRTISTIASGSAAVGQGQMSSDGNDFRFGPYKIDPKEVFYLTNLSFAMVNLRPVVPGCLLGQNADLEDNKDCWHGGKRREVKRFGDLTAEETSDIWFAAKKIGTQLECFHKATSITFTIQDGPEAGQSVPHVHIHVLPRKGGDFEKNDQIYDAIDEKEKELKQKLDLDKERKDRSLEEMAQEAEEYRSLFL